MYGDDREQMVTTYKKMAAISISIGQPASAQKYFRKIEELTAAFEAKHGVTERTDAQVKEALEEKSNLYFQQYLAAN